MANETVEQVCELMTGWENHTWMSSTDHKYIGELAKRILAAHKRELAAKDALIKEIADVIVCPPLCEDCDESCENRTECAILELRGLIAKAREVING